MGSSLEKKIALFDVDDTLVSTSSLAFEKTKLVANALGGKVPSDEEFFAVYGKLTFEDCIKKLFPGLDIEEYREVYESLRTELPYRPIGQPHVVFELLLENQFLLGVLTNGPGEKTELKLAAAGISAYIRAQFMCVLHSDNLLNMKPSPLCFDQALSGVNIERERVFYIGDSIEDFTASSGAGVNFIAVLSGYTNRRVFDELGVDPKNIVDSIMEVPKYFGLDDISTKNKKR